MCLTCEPRLGRNGLLQPLLQVTRIERADTLPLCLCTAIFFPFCFARPASRSDEHENGFVTNCLFRVFRALCVIAVGLRFNVFGDAKLPSRLPLRDPRCSLSGDYEAIPTGALGIVVAREVDLR